MQIIHTVYTAFPMPVKGYGGVETGVYSLCKEQARRGHEVYVLCNSKSRIPGCMIVPCGIAQNENQDRETQKNYAIRLCSTKKIQLIHDHSPWGHVGLTNCKVPVIKTVYGDPHKKYISTLRKDTLITFTTRGFAEFYGYPTAPLIHPAIFESPERIIFNSSQRSDWLLFVGRIVEYKGPHIAIEWAKAAHKRLLIVGPIGNQTFFEKEIVPHLTHNSKNIKRALYAVEKKSKQKHIVAYGGAVSKEQLWELYVRARATLVSSICVEAMSRVVQESMLTGCPVLTRPVGGILESMGGDVGGRASYCINDIIEFEKTINDWYNPFFARDHILKTRTASIMADSCEVIYRNILGRELL